MASGEGAANAGHYPAGFRRGLIFTGTGSVVNLALLFVETLVVARWLPADAFGSYVLLVATVNLLLMAVDFGCKSAVTPLIAGADRPRQQAVLGTVLVFRVLVVAGSAALVWLLRSLLIVADPASGLAEHLGYVPMMLAAASLDELLAGMLQGFQAYRSMAIAQIGRGLLRVALTVSLVSALGPGTAALAYSWTISFALSALFQLRTLPIRHAWRMEPALLREIIRFGFPLQLTRLLWFAAARLHLALLGALAGPASVAHLAVAARIPDALQLLYDSYFRVYFPTMAALLASRRREAAGRVLDQSLRLVSFAGALAAVVAIVFSQEIVTLTFGATYSADAPIFALLMLALHMSLLVNVLGYTLTAAGRSGRSLGVDLVRAVVSAGADVALIPGFGALGSAYATLLSSYASGPVAAWLVRRSALTAAVAPHVKQSLILLLCAGLVWWAYPSGLAHKLAILVLFFVLSALSATITRDDLAILGGGATREAGGTGSTAAAPLRAMVSVAGPDKG
jgi:O-antigen/teichoic acid export membrane protein